LQSPNVDMEFLRDLGNRVRGRIAFIATELHGVLELGNIFRSARRRHIVCVGEGLGGYVCTRRGAFRCRAVRSLSPPTSRV
jgi:hypothetical protein